MNKSRVLVVDDDVSIRKFVRANLEARYYEVILATNGTEAMHLFEKQAPDLIILDIMMPEMDGFKVCRLVREKSTVPIIMLSAKEGEGDKLRCLELGADDYLTKPFSLNELLMRIKAILRRSLNHDSPILHPTFSIGDLEIDYNNHMVYIKGQDVNLTNTEYEIMAFLTINAGRIISPQLILEKVWGEDYIGKPRVLWVNLSRLRRKLKEWDSNRDYIYTKPGMGYLIKEKMLVPTK